MVVEAVGGGRSIGRWRSSRGHSEEEESRNERGEEECNIVYKSD